MTFPSRELLVRPIGVIRSPFVERAEAPRQPRAALGVEGRIELEPGRGFEDAVADLEGWQYVWVIAWFDRNTSWRPKVQPPRSRTKRGVFSTRSPHRPNPIALSVLELVRVEGLTLHVRNLDLLDGTPVLDVKPYVPWTDSIGDARVGWLGTEGAACGESAADPGPSYEVVFEPSAEEDLGWLAEAGVSLRQPLVQALGLGPSPHAYRRIKRDGDRGVIAIKEWRAHFRVEGRVVTIERIRSGYRRAELAARPLDDVHRRIEARYDAERLPLEPG